MRLPDLAGNGASHLDQVPLEMIRRMLIVDPDQPVRDLMWSMRLHRCHAALVQTPDGQLLGMVTLEDVLEALVGDIRDETRPGGLVAAVSGADDVVTAVDVNHRTGGGAKPVRQQSNGCLCYGAGISDIPAERCTVVPDFFKS